MKITEEDYTPIVHYPKAIEFRDRQAKVMWRPDEPKVENDIQDLRVNLSVAENKAISLFSKTFTSVEVLAGNCYWGGRARKLFPRYDIDQVCSLFSYMESGVHAPFYVKLDEVLHQNTPEFYDSYRLNPSMKDKLDYVAKIINHPNDHISVGGFALVEGVLIYSAFSFFSSFQSNGSNRLTQFCRGIEYSVRDENIHAEFGAWLFTTMLKEADLHNDRKEAILLILTQVARTIVDIEIGLIEQAHTYGDLPTWPKKEAINFVKHRANYILNLLGEENCYFGLDLENNTVYDSFYQKIGAPKHTDFFTGLNTEYVRLSESAFKEGTWEV